MAVRGGWRPLSGLICEIVNSVALVREKSGKSQGISNTYGCGNHELVAVCLLDKWEPNFRGQVLLKMFKCN